MAVVTAGVQKVMCGDLYLVLALKQSDTKTNDP
jgi:hypothetical protein